MSYNIENVASELMIEPSDLIEVLRYFFIETPEILEQCNQAMISSDFNLLKKLFHSLKGSTSNLRITHLNQLTSTLEDGATAQDLAFLSNQLTTFQEEFYSFMKHFEISVT